MQGVLVDFSAESINSFYSLDHVPSEPFNRLYEHPDYPEIIRVLTNGQGEWKINSAGHAVHFKAKHLAFIPKVWHHFITSRLIPTTNVCEVTAERALLNYAILQDIHFDVGQVIEDAILHNQDAKMNLGHPFLIFGLCNEPGCPWTTMRPGSTLSRPYLSSGTHLVSRDLRSHMIPIMSPRTRTSFMSIELVMDPWAIPRETLASPRPTHLHHHPSSLERQLPPVLPPILRTRCSHSLSASTHSRMRPMSTESSSHRIWRLYVLTCGLSWPIRPSFFSSSRPCRPRSHSSWPSTSLHHHHRTDHQGSPLHLYYLFLASADTGYFVWGGCGDRVLFFLLVMFCFSVGVVFLFCSAY